MSNQSIFLDAVNKLHKLKGIELLLDSVQIYNPMMTSASWGGSHAAAFSRPELSLKVSYKLEGCWAECKYSGYADAFAAGSWIDAVAKIPAGLPEGDKAVARISWLLYALYRHLTHKSEEDLATALHGGTLSVSYVF